MRYEWPNVYPTVLDFHKQRFAVLEVGTGRILSPCFVADEETGRFERCALDESGNLALRDGRLQYLPGQAQLRVFQLGGWRTFWCGLCSVLPVLLWLVPRGTPKQVSIRYFRYDQIGKFQNGRNYMSPPKGAGWRLVETYQRCYRRQRVQGVRGHTWQEFWQGYERWERNA